jgi:phosphoribosylanthranilate isomerase
VGSRAGVRVKVCGVTSVEQAVACLQAGVDAIGVNLVPSSPRRVSMEVAREVSKEVGSSLLVVAVVSNLTVPAMLALRAATGVECLQLHGDETASEVEALLPHAYKAGRIAGPADVEALASMPGDYVLADTKVEGALGGTGLPFDWSLVANLATRRRLVLAGGLTPGNVAAAIGACHPWCVDVASGVESRPGIKDMGLVKAFVEAAKGA